jgi:hypothetical protein
MPHDPVRIAETKSWLVKAARDTLNTGQFDPDFCRRDLLARNPMAWMIEVNGLVVDARMLPPELQAEARRRGLIPDLDALG